MIETFRLFLSPLLPPDLSTQPPPYTAPLYHSPPIGHTQHHRTPVGKRTPIHTHARILRTCEISQITRRRSTPAPRRPRRAYITVVASPSLSVCLETSQQYGVHRQARANSAFICYNGIVCGVAQHQLSSTRQPRVAVALPLHRATSNCYVHCALTAENLFRDHAPLLYIVVPAAASTTVSIL